MPVICYKNKIKIEDYEENLSIAFVCEYDSNNHLKIKNSNAYFDSGDYRIKIENLIKKLNRDIIEEYDNKNKGVRYLAILNYFLDNMPDIYSIKFESEDGESIYYKEEYKKIGK